MDPQVCLPPLGNDWLVVPHVRDQAEQRIQAAVDGGVLSKVNGSGA
jgi:hypothetical protein